MPLKLLVANRGEIAVRVINECKKLGIKTVAICSEIERSALHMKLADEGYCIGPAAPQDSYMNKDVIVNAAVITHADMIHPGYGFLSESNEFAKQCEQRNISFVGPVSRVIARVSDKFSMKQIAASLQVPVLGGYVVRGVEEALEQAHEIGYPIMLKAARGGGGAGIKAVYEDGELINAFEIFQNDRYTKLFVEKYIENARHIEIQIMADNHGNVVTLGSRECSMQIHNKKVLEECPANRLSAQKLDELYTDSLKLAKAVNYTGMGTLEFLVDDRGKHYFMEMNARIQVEHGITEMITGLNLIHWQIRIAQGDTIPFKQDDIKLSGHALECRVNAQSLGRIDGWRLRNNEARFDHALTDALTLTPYYDSMLGKLISYGSSRNDAIDKMRTYLDDLQISGIETNIGLHKKILNNECFINGLYYTNFLNNIDELPHLTDYTGELQPAGAEVSLPVHVKVRSFSWARTFVESAFRDKGVYKEA